jgi:hypothetical protein
LIFRLSGVGHTVLYFAYQSAANAYEKKDVYLARMSVQKNHKSGAEEG